MTARNNPAELTEQQKKAFQNASSINMVPNPYDLAKKGMEDKSLEQKQIES